MDSAIKNFEVEKTTIKVVKAGSGSLVTDFLVFLYGEYQSNIEDSVVDGIEAMFKTDIPAEYETAVTIATLAVTYFVMRYAYDAVRARRPDKPASTHIAGEYVTVVNIFAEKVGLSPSQVEDELHRRMPVSKRRHLVQSVTKFLRPRDDGRPTPIDIEGYGEVSDAVQSEYPTDSELLEIDESKNIDLVGAVLDIRRMDKDMATTGWAAQIVGDQRFKKRMPMELSPTVDIARLAELAARPIVGDVVIEGDRKPDGTFKGKRIHLLSFEDPPQG